MNNYYKLLGLQENASKEQINEAYKKLSLKFHPDKNNNDPFFSLLFQQITEAKQVLTDNEKKSEYDLLLINYSDAYELFSKQKLEDDFNRQEKRKYLAKKAARRKKVVLFSAIAIISCLFIFLLVDSGSTLLGNNTEFKADRQISSDSVRLISPNLPGGGKKKSDPARNDSLLLLTQKKTVKEHNILVNKKGLKSNESKPFTADELENLLATINNERSTNNYLTNCITIKKTRNSNVDNDWLIASYLQQKGFTIAGREIIPGSFKGIEVGFNGVCLTLMIGD